MIIAFTGAGISKESSIETFQDRPDVREKLYRWCASRRVQRDNASVKVRKFLEEHEDKIGDFKDFLRREDR